MTLLKSGIMLSPYIFRQSYLFRVGIMLKLYQGLLLLTLRKRSFGYASPDGGPSQGYGSSFYSDLDSASFEGLTRRSLSGGVSSCSETGSRGAAPSSETASS